MSDLDMSEHLEALTKLARSLRMEPDAWRWDDLVDVAELAKQVAGMSQTIQLQRALGGR